MRIRTFGGLWIEANEPPLLGPRPLALLAIVAEAGPKGVSRDRVIGILWPETGEEQARHTLSQTLYSMRREARRDLIEGSSLLRLDDAVQSDIREFRRALAAGEPERAANAYTGRFLEGFYLPGAEEFERWVEEERQSLHQEALRAIERAARAAADGPVPAQSVPWWQRLSELDPLNARFALGHMRALAAAGDSSGALARARTYREVVHRELGAEPDPAIRKLELELRSAPAPTTPLATVRPASSPTMARPPGVRMPTRGWLVLAVVIVLGALAIALRGAFSPSNPDRPFLAVGEIHTESASDSTRVGAILRDMLATHLGAIEGLQVVANSRLVELMPRGPDPAPGAIADAARRAGATEVLEGELSVESAGLTLSLRRVTLGRGVVRQGYVVHAADRAGLIESATEMIARDLKLAPPSITIAQSRTASPTAYALYDEGVRAYYGYDAPAAYRLMKAAFSRDSTFAMAAYYVWHLAKFFGDGETQARTLPYVERLALKSIERERLLIQLSLAAEGEVPTPVSAALAETLTVKYPQDPEGQILLGQALSGVGDWSGSIAAYERAIVLDSTAGALAGPYCRVCRALAFQTVAYTWWDSLAAAERTARRLIAFRPDDTGPLGSPWENLVEVLLRLGRRAEAEDAVRRSTGSLSTPHTARVLHRDLIRWGQFERVDRELIADLAHPNADMQEDAWWLLLLSLRDQGRLREADTLIHRWRVANTSIRVAGGKAPAGDLALLGLEMGRPEVSVRAHRENVVTMSSGSPPAIRARNIAWQLALAGTAHATAGDTAVVRRMVDSLEEIGQGSSYWGRDAKLHYVLRGLLLQKEGRHAEAVDAFRRSFYSVSDGYTRVNLMMARSLLVLRRPTEAIGVLRPAIRGGVDGSNTYTSRTELHEALAQAFEQAGQADSARFHWRAVESAWRHADPPFRERYLTARRKAGLK